MPALFCDEIGQTSWFPVDNVHKLWIKLLNKYKLFENYSCKYEIALLIR